jgi:uroporphyrinogen decarboxylase
MDKMTSLERVMTTVHHQIPDRVPTDLHNFLNTVEYAGYPLAQALQSGEMMAEAQLKFWREFGHDALLVENGVIAEAQACGCDVEYFDDRPPRVAGHILAESLDKVDELEVPDPFTTFPMSELLKAVRILVEEIGDEVYIMGRSDQGPVALAMALRGYEQFVVDLALHENTDAIIRVIEYATKVHIRYGQAMKEVGAHGTSMGEAGVDIIGPNLYREFANQYDRQVVAAVGGPDFPFALHICGDATKILPDMVATGAQILELDYKTDMREAKRLMQGKTTFLGPVNPELIYMAKSTDEVEAAVREALEILAPGGGLILGPGCALGLGNPTDNIHALVESAKKYGVYNADGTLKGTH